MDSSYYFLAFALLSTAFGHFFYKKYFFEKKYFFILFSIFLFFLTPIFSFLALKKIALDIVYISTSLTIIITMMLGRFFLDEKLTKNQILSCFVIILGIVVYNL